MEPVNSRRRRRPLKMAYSDAVARRPVEIPDLGEIGYWECHNAHQATSHFRPKSKGEEDETTRTAGKIHGR
jgi:hypothetical protein